MIDSIFLGTSTAQSLFSKIVKISSRAAVRDALWYATICVAPLCIIVQRLAPVILIKVLLRHVLLHWLLLVFLGLWCNTFLKNCDSCLVSILLHHHVNTNSIALLLGVAHWINTLRLLVRVHLLGLCCWVCYDGCSLVVLLTIHEDKILIWLLLPVLNCIVSQSCRLQRNLLATIKLAIRLEAHCLVLAVWVGTSRRTCHIVNVRWLGLLLRGLLKHLLLGLGHVRVTGYLAWQKTLLLALRTAHIGVFIGIGSAYRWHLRNCYCIAILHDLQLLLTRSVHVQLAIAGLVMLIELQGSSWYVLLRVVKSGQLPRWDWSWLGLVFSIGLVLRILTSPLWVMSVGVVVLNLDIPSLFAGLWYLI